MTVDLGATSAVAAATDPLVPRVGACGDLVPEAPHPDSGTPSRPRPAAGSPPVAGPVLAVMVARDGEAFLPRALEALAAQTYRPDAVIAVDAGSRDSSASLLREAVPVVLRLPRSASFGDAVDAALAVRNAPRPLPGDPRPDGSCERAGSDDGWIWLLHDDCAPAPDTLERLLVAVETAPSVAIAGCKQLDWDDDQRILDVGLTTTRSGGRVPIADRFEVDQGQYDGRSDVLAVGTAGMLVRQDLWRRLGGPDPGLTHARDDLDLCRRAHLAGSRVVVVPGADVAHAAAWSSGRRPATPSWWLADRRDALHQRLTATSWLLLPLLVVWTACAVWPRAAFQLAALHPRRALDELLAPPLVWARPDRLTRSRRRAARTRRVPRRVVRRLYAAPWRLLARSRDEIAAWVVPFRGPRDAGRADGGAPRPTASPGRVRTRSRAAGFLPVLLATTAVSGAALHRLIGTGAAIGPDLLPAPGTAAALWRSARASWRPSGLGASATADPIDSLLAVLSLPLGGVPGRAVDLLLLAGLPLAALTAWLAAGALTESRLVRAWASLVWAASPPLLAALSAGRVGAVLAHVALPAAALAVARAALDGGPRRRLRAGCAAGLLLTTVLSGAPSLAVAVAVAVLVVAVAAVLHGHGPLAVPAGLLPALAIPGGLLLPWWFAVVRDPRLLLAHAGPGGTGAGAEVWEGLPLGASQELTQLMSGAVPAAVTVPTGVQVMILTVALGGPVVLAAVGALLRRGSVALTATAVIIGLTGLATALVAVRVEVGADGSGLDGGSPFAGPHGPGLSLGILGLLAAAVAFRRTGRRTAGPGSGAGPIVGRARRSLRRLVPVAVMAGLLAGPLVVLGGWAWQGVAGPGHLARPWAPAVHRAEPDVLPAIAADEAEGAAAARTLVVQDDRSTVRWTLARAAGPRLGDDSAALAALRLDGRDAPWPRGKAASEATVVAPVLAALLGDSSADARGRLAELGIGSVLLVPPVPAATALALDASPGLTRVTAGQGAVLWRVDLAAQPGAPARAARARIVDERGFTVTTLASRGDRLDVTVQPSGAHRYVVLTDRYHAGWTATLDGRPMRGLPTSGWAQCFDLPAGAGGRLRIEHRFGTPGAVDPIGAAVAVLALAGLVPVPEIRRRLARPAPPSPSRPVPRAEPTGPVPDRLPPMPRVFDTDHPETGAVAPLFRDSPDEPEASTEERPVVEENR